MTTKSKSVVDEKRVDLDGCGRQRKSSRWERERSTEQAVAAAVAGTVAKALAVAENMSEPSRHHLLY